jgi:hypothetical protein
MIPIVHEKEKGLAYRGEACRLFSFPQIIELILVVAFGAISFEHAGKDHEVGGGYVGYLKANIVYALIDMIHLAPFAARAEHHEGIIGNFTAQLDPETKVQVWRDGFQRFHSETAGADVGQMTHQFAGVFIHQAHVIRKIASAYFSAFGHNCILSFYGQSIK